MSTTHIAGPNQLKDAYRHLTDRISEAAVRCGRRPHDIIVVAVTKTASPDQIRTLVDMGHVDLGENRVQQLVQRHAQLGEFLNRKRSLGRALPEGIDDSAPTVRWHMVGHLQRNKVKPIMPLVKLIHSVDSLRLAEEIQSVAGRDDRVVDILLQVNTAGEAAKQGVAAPAALHLAEQINTMMHLRLRGLMAIAPLSDDPETARPTFARTAEIFHEIRSEGVGGDQFNILSMGMSNDYEIAIEQGANLLRIGRALFGEG